MPSRSTPRWRWSRSLGNESPQARAIPTTAVPAIRKPANDVRVIPEDAAAAQAVHAFEEHAAVALVAVAGE